MIFSLGRCLLELSQEPACVALTLHGVGSSAPFGVTLAMLLWLCSATPDMGNPCNPDEPTLSAERVSEPSQRSHFPPAPMPSMQPHGVLRVPFA